MNVTFFLLESVTVARPAPPDALLVSTPICGEYYITVIIVFLLFSSNLNEGKQYSTCILH